MDPQALRVLLLAGLGACASGAPEDPSVATDTGAMAQEIPLERPIHERIDLPSVAACGGCHVEVFREWSQSLHARAWTNENVRTATDDFAKKSCRSCHSPRSVFETGFDRRPAYRDFNQVDGVHCLSCHGLQDGVAAGRTIPDAPCRPRYEPRLLEADHCYPCHEPTHQAFQEYETSDAYALGIRCMDCHMPPAEGRPGRSHGPHGGLNPEFVARGVAWEVARGDRGVEITLRNRTGHKFPGEIPSRSLLVEVAFDGAPSEIEVLRRPHKGEERADNRLLPDEVRVLVRPIPPGARRAQVNILFRPLPLLPLESAFELGAVSLEL